MIMMIISPMERRKEKTKLNFNLKPEQGKTKCKLLILKSI